MIHYLIKLFFLFSAGFGICILEVCKQAGTCSNLLNKCPQWLSACVCMHLSGSLYQKSVCSLSRLSLETTGNEQKQVFTGNFERKIPGYCPSSRKSPSWNCDSKVFDLQGAVISTSNIYTQTHHEEHAMYFFAPNATVNRGNDRLEARRQYARTNYKHKHLGSNGKVLTTRTRACLYRDKAKQFANTRRSICRHIVGSCSLYSLSTFRQILAEVCAQMLVFSKISSLLHLF